MKKPTEEKLWTKNFLILWQGQLVSTLGDAAYSIALGFWVLSVTGSTTLMGLLQAASTLPGILISPFTGVLIDRVSRKKLLVLMDLLRGAAIVLVGVAAFQGWLQIWMVFAAGVLLSLCGAAFRPGVMAAIPDLVPKQKLSNANSAFSVVGTGATMLGSVSGGFLFQILGAPLLFLFNGLSYLFSGFSILFMHFTKKEIKLDEDFRFMEDMNEGFRYIWKQKGLRDTILLAALTNFFSFIAIVLLLPLFQKTPSLGSGLYGAAMACYMGGCMAGFVVFSIVTIPARKNLMLFALANTVSSLSLILGILYLNNHLLMMGLILTGGFFNSIINVIFMSTVQGATPSEMRGKVMAFMSMATQSLTPVAMALGGVLGGIFPIPTVIITSFSIVLFGMVPFYFRKSFGNFLKGEPEESLPAVSEVQEP
jgi:Arabinose efflux permease